MQQQTKELRNKEIKIRLTESEHSTLLAKSTKPRLAEWMREFCLSSEQSKKNEMPSCDPKFLAEFSKIGSNLNQIARAVNTVRLSNKPLDKVEILSALSSIEAELNELKRMQQ